MSFVSKSAFKAFGRLLCSRPKAKTGALKLDILISSVNPVYREVLYDSHSKMQHIQIVDTVDQGRMMLLDGLVNLAESDTVAYTHVLMGLPEVMVHAAQVVRGRLHVYESVYDSAYDSMHDL
jgi:hypothetical protein